MPNLPAIASTLLQLTGISIAELSRQAELHRPNLVSWLGGKEHVLSRSKQLKACDALGWRDGSLRRDCIHRWVIENGLDPLQHALPILEPEKTDFGFATVIDAGIEIGGVLLGFAANRPPLLILIARDRIGAQSVSWSQGLPSCIRIAPDSLSANQSQWNWWWEDFQNHEVTGFLDGAAKYVLGELWPQDYARLAGLAIATDPSAIKQQWLALLAEANEAGVDTRQLIDRVRQFLSKRN